MPTSFISSPDPTVFSDNKKVAIYIFQSAKLPCVNSRTDWHIFSFALLRKGLSHEMDLAFDDMHCQFLAKIRDAVCFYIFLVLFLNPKSNKYKAKSISWDSPFKLQF